MKKYFLAALAGASLFGATPAVAQGLGHSWIMRGQIVAKQSDAVILCVGKIDGAQPGQVLDVYRASYHPHGPKSNQPTYQRIKVGSVTINEIIDDHFAKARVTEGKVARNDLVELRRE